MNQPKAQMLATIRASLAQSRTFLDAEAARAAHTPPPFVHPPADDLVGQFVAELTKLEGHAHCCANDEAALAAIAEILTTHQAKTVLAWDVALIGLPGLEERLATLGVTVLDGAVQGAARHERLQALEPALVGISGVEAGIAESATLLLRHGPGRPRLASLLAPVHIAVLRAEQLLRGLGEAIAMLRQRYGTAIFDATSNLTLITGPSRTADIEMTLTLGIHGPREIHVVIIGAER